MASLWRASVASWRALAASRHLAIAARDASVSASALPKFPVRLSRSSLLAGARSGSASAPGPAPPLAALPRLFCRPARRALPGLAAVFSLSSSPAAKAHGRQPARQPASRPTAHRAGCCSARLHPRLSRGPSRRPRCRAQSPACRACRARPRSG